MLFALTIILIALSMFAFRQLIPSWSKASPEPELNLDPTAEPQISAISKGHRGGESSPRKNARNIDKEGGAKSRRLSPASEDTASGSAEDHSPNVTPKAGPQKDLSVAIPSFALNTGDSSEEEEDDLPPPSFPALNSAQRASGGASLMLPPQAPKPSTALNMPPPPRSSSKNQAHASATASFRIPSTGPLPNRGPVQNRGPIVGSSLSIPVTGPVKTSNARQKVLLDPGHSPLDWANLVKSGRNLAGVSSMVRVTPSQLKFNNGRKGKPAWSVWQGKVYNITPYLPFHPGGKGELMRAAGKDGTKLFMDVHPWVNWDNMLGECLVGILVGEGDASGPKTSSLEDMD